MSYQKFKQMVRSICARAGGGIRLRFSQEDDRYIAVYDDIEITANSQSSSLTVRWGSGQNHKPHMAMIPAEVRCGG